MAEMAVSAVIPLPLREGLGEGVALKALSLAIDSLCRPPSLALPSGGREQGCLAVRA
jgi:hypothetical protein